MHSVVKYRSNKFSFNLTHKKASVLITITPPPPTLPLHTKNKNQKTVHLVSVCFVHTFLRFIRGLRNNFMLSVPVVDLEEFSVTGGERLISS